MFAAAQLFGRAGAAVMWQLRKRADGSVLTKKLFTSLRTWAKAFLTVRSRPMREKASRLILFTGGLGDYEHVRQAGLGAVLLDEATKTFEAFGALIPGQLADLLTLFVGGEDTVEQAAVVDGSTSWPRDTP